MQGEMVVMVRNVAKPRSSEVELPRVSLRGITERKLRLDVPISEVERENMVRRMKADYVEEIGVQTRRRLMFRVEVEFGSVENIE